MPRCDLSDLDEKECACRLHAPEVKLIDIFKVEDSRVFTAKFNGKCAECLEKTYEGELITKTSIGYVHEECA